MKVTKSGGDVFLDLGLGASAALKSQVAMDLCKIIRSRKINQTKAAALLGWSQPDVSNLMNGKISHFSVDRLVDALGIMERRRILISYAPVKSTGKHQTRDVAIKSHIPEYMPTPACINTEINILNA